MLKELFESCFYKTFPTKKNVIVNLTEKSYSGTFSLLDAEACRDCRLQCDPIPSNRKQLMVLTAKNVNTIKVDSIFKPVKEDYGRMCDYLMDDGNKFALIEMTCATQKYVESKRVTCIGQLYNTLTNLRTCGPVRQHIEKAAEREAIFSWKGTFDSADLFDPVEKSMTAMTDIGDDVYSPHNVSAFESGFLYREIRYPDVWVW